MAFVRCEVLGTPLARGGARIHRADFFSGPHPCSGRESILDRFEATTPSVRVRHHQNLAVRYPAAKDHGSVCWRVDSVVVLGYRQIHTSVSGTPTVFRFLEGVDNLRLGSSDGGAVVCSLGGDPNRYGLGGEEVFTLCFHRMRVSERSDAPEHTAGTREEGTVRGGYSACPAREVPRAGRAQNEGNISHTSIAPRFGYRILLSF